MAEENQEVTRDTRMTINHDRIRQWAEARGGEPALAQDAGEDEVTALRIAFDEDEQEVDPISWEKFFNTFDHETLAFVYETETKESGESRYYELIDRTSLN